MFIVKTDVKTALKHKKSEKQLIDLFDRYGLFYIGRPRTTARTFLIIERSYNMLNQQYSVSYISHGHQSDQRQEKITNVLIFTVRPFSYFKLEVTRKTNCLKHSSAFILHFIALLNTE